MLPFHPEPDLVDARSTIRRAVDAVLAKLRAGVLPDDAELEHVDIKEEAGRRGSGGALLAGQAQNTAAAAQLADEVACFANTPGGGALIVGIENKTGDLLGTALDRDWLRHGIYTRVDLAPDVEEREVSGVRLLVLYVASAHEPIEDTSGRIRWRVGVNCVAVDRSEWWLHRQSQAGHDSMAAVTSRTVVDVSDGAIVTARRYLRDAGFEHHASETVADLLRRLGVLHPDGHLTQAGALLFCPADRTYLSMTAIDVEGGDVLLRPPDLTGLSVLEQLSAVEDRLNSLNTEVTLQGGFAEPTVRRLPPRAVREAVLNGLVHRDWLSSGPVTITWIDADSALQVTSPGGFTGGITAATVLAQRYARHPALADLFRALNLVEKQGMGVDRMYREMVALGHRPPLIVEEDGPRVRTRLVGGRPVVPVMALTGRIEPAVRRRDVRVALIVDHLLRQPFATPDLIAELLQRAPQEAAEALETAATECRVGSSPLLTRFKDVWILSSAAIRVVESAAPAPDRRARGILNYRRPDDPGAVVRFWLASHSRITSGDYATLTGLTQTGSLNHLDRLVIDGVLVRGDGKGRNAHFLAAMP
ncbi:ATP-binding protein [Pseudonocardia hydrocarbonoxydans]|uniref:Transcriptional regulator n=1 Tax=Pseudonocardia hydrocarbonoxydans TaxID=76726 RepID=A0A4Y3WVA3_9PSEU|nr:transcriptional regulator [Pseudonocardia hydrocarbonoxydans]